MVERLLAEARSGSTLKEYNLFMDSIGAEVKRFGLRPAVQPPDIFSPLAYFER